MIGKFDSKILKSLNKSEFEVFSYISNHAEDVLQMTITELARENYVSTTTIVRLCKKLGFTGYSEFKFHLKQTLLEKAVRPKLNYKESAQKHLLDVERTLSMIHEDTLDRIVNLIQEKRIHFFAKGLSSIACEYITNQFLAMSLLAINYTTTHIAYLSAEKMSEMDVVFVMSMSGETSQSLRFARIAKSRGATVVSITSMGMNSLTKLADISLYVYAEEDQSVPFDNKSRASTLLLFQVILEMYNNRR